MKTSRSSTVSKYTGPAANPHLGQNFLVDQDMIQRMVAAADLHPDQPVLEIGPGQGALTGPLLRRVTHLYAVEKDRHLYEALVAAYPEAASGTFLNADILTFDPGILPSPITVIGNIPYNISTPILEWLIAGRERWPRVFLTVQREFAARLVAGSGRKDYGSLTCTLRYYADVQVLFHVPNRCFRPAPKVASSFVRIDFRPPVLRAQDEDLLFRIIRQAFQQRRKKILNALQGVVDRPRLAAVLSQASLSADRRPDSLSLQDYVDLANGLAREERTG